MPHASVLCHQYGVLQLPLCVVRTQYSRTTRVVLVLGSAGRSPVDNAPRPWNYYNPCSAARRGGLQAVAGTSVDAATTAEQNSQVLVPQSKSAQPWWRTLLMGTVMVWAFAMASMGTRSLPAHAAQHGHPMSNQPPVSHMGYTPTASAVLGWSGAVADRAQQFASRLTVEPSSYAVGMTGALGMLMVTAAALRRMDSSGAASLAGLPDSYEPFTTASKSFLAEQAAATTASRATMQQLLEPATSNKSAAPVKDTPLAVRPSSVFAAALAAAQQPKQTTPRLGSPSKSWTEPSGSDSVPADDVQRMNAADVQGETTKSARKAVPTDRAAEALEYEQLSTDSHSGVYVHVPANVLSVNDNSCADKPSTAGTLAHMKQARVGRADTFANNVHHDIAQAAGAAAGAEAPCADMNAVHENEIMQNATFSQGVGLDTTNRQGQGESGVDIPTASSMQIAEVLHQLKQARVGLVTFSNNAQYDVAQAVLAQAAAARQGSEAQKDHAGYVLQNESNNASAGEQSETAAASVATVATALEGVEQDNSPAGTVAFAATASEEPVKDVDPVSAIAAAPSPLQAAEDVSTALDVVTAAVIASEGVEEQSMSGGGAAAVAATLMENPHLDSSIGGTIALQEVTTFPGSFAESSPVGKVHMVSESVAEAIGNQDPQDESSAYVQTVDAPSPVEQSYEEYEELSQDGYLAVAAHNASAAAGAQLDTTKGDEAQQAEQSTGDRTASMAPTPPVVEPPKRGLFGRLFSFGRQAAAQEEEESDKQHDGTISAVARTAEPMTASHTAEQAVVQDEISPVMAMLSDMGLQQLPAGADQQNAGDLSRIRSQFDVLQSFLSMEAPTVRSKYDPWTDIRGATAPTGGRDLVKVILTVEVPDGASPPAPWDVLGQLLAAEAPTLQSDADPLSSLLRVRPPNKPAPSDDPLAALLGIGPVGSSGLDPFSALLAAQAPSGMAALDPLAALSGWNPVTSVSGFDPLGNLLQAQPPTDIAEHDVVKGLRNLMPPSASSTRTCPVGALLRAEAPTGAAKGDPLQALLRWQPPSSNSDLDPLNSLLKAEAPTGDGKHDMLKALARALPPASGPESDPLQGLLKAEPPREGPFDMVKDLLTAVKGGGSGRKDGQQQSSRESQRDPGPWPAEAPWVVDLGSMQGAQGERVNLYGVAYPKP